MLLGLLMMVTRRNAVSQIVGFMSLENGLILAATGAKGMPLVVEISVAFSVLIAFIVIGVFLFRIRERFDTVDVAGARRLPGRAAMTVRRFAARAADCVLVIPRSRPRVLALLPGYWLAARLNVAGDAGDAGRRACRCCSSGRQPAATCSSTTSTSSSSCSTTFVGFTTSVFSASYIAHEIEIGRLTPRSSALLSRHVPGADVRHEPRRSSPTTSA